MKIESLGPLNTSADRLREGDRARESTQGVSSLKESNTTPKQPPETEKNMLIKAVESLQRAAETADKKLKFEIDEEASRTVVKVVDSESGELIKQIPSEELLTFVKNMNEFRGSLLDTRI